MKRIYSIAGLKIIALGFIFYLHLGLPRVSWINFNWGLNFFFASSGFLVARKYFRIMNWDGFGAGCSYLRMKLCAVWPLHVLGFLVVVIAMGTTALSQEVVWYRGLFNLLLLHAWSAPDHRLAFSFNGASWFLSAILFCYLMAPLCLSFVRVVNSKYIDGGVFCFLLVAIFRYVVFSAEKKFHMFGLDLYCSPAMRCLDFWCAMAAYPVFEKIAGVVEIGCSTKWKKILLSLSEALAVMIIVYFAYTPNHYAHYITVIYWQIFAITIFAFDAGIISKILSAKPLQWLSSIEMEFFILHYAMIVFLGKVFKFKKLGALAYALSILFIVLILSFLYKRYLADRLAKAVDVALRKIYL